MPNKNRGKVNQPPTGQGKKQSTQTGASRKLDKRSEVLQAQRGRADQNVGTDFDEEAARADSLQPKDNPKRQKAGR
jgi:hypothetical protein